jgi:hypothetical protein
MPATPFTRKPEIESSIVPTNPVLPRPRLPVTNTLASTSSPALLATTSNSPPQVRSEYALANPASAARIWSLHEGKFQLNVKELPVVGSADAPKLILNLFDWTCPHCKYTHELLLEVQQTFSNQLAIVSMPLPLDAECNPCMEGFTPPMHANACEYARLGLAVWRADPSKFAAFDGQMYADARPPALQAARESAEQLVGATNLVRALEDPWIKARIKDATDLLAVHLKLFNRGDIPQLVIGRRMVFGQINNTNLLFQILEEERGLKRP